MPENDCYCQVSISTYRHRSINHIHCMVGTCRNLWESSLKSFDKWVQFLLIINYLILQLSQSCPVGTPSFYPSLFEHFLVSDKIHTHTHTHTHTPLLACSFHASCTGIKPAPSIRTLISFVGECSLEDTSGCCVYVFSHFSHVWLLVTLWTMALQAPLHMGFSRQEYWDGLSCLPSGDLGDPRIEPASPALQADSLHWTTGETQKWVQAKLITIGVSMLPGPLCKQSYRM